VDAARRFGTGNFGGVSDPGLDEAIEKSAQVLSAADRQKALGAIVRRVTEQHLLVPLYVDENVSAVVRPFVFRPRANSYVLAQEISREGI
jgi:peptide/nickel transport system substrate-binding protein